MEESPTTDAPPPPPPAQAPPAAAAALGSTSASSSSSSSAVSSSASARTAVSRMRHVGRLKSFSSRQRAAQQQQQPPQPMPAPLAKSSVRGGARRRWSTNSARQQPAAAAAAGGGAALPPVSAAPPRDAQLELLTGNSSRQRADDEETKESADSAPLSRLEVQQQIQQTRPLQRVQCLRLTCAAPPELVLPYLYGDRKSRINAIMQDTACTIDYCPMSPDDEPQSPQSRAYIMNFLVSGESAASLENATRMLRALIDKVEVHLQKKMRIRSLHAMAHRAASSERLAAAAAAATTAQDAPSDAQSSATPYTVGVAADPRLEREREREREPFPTRLHRTGISPAALETPVDRYRLSHNHHHLHHLHHAGLRPTEDDFARREYPGERSGARLAALRVDVDDATYYDRWGRPVFRHEQVVATDAFGHSAGGDADADSDAPAHALPGLQAPSRHAPLRRRWQYVDEPEWRQPPPPRIFVHAAAASDERDAPPPPSTERGRVVLPVRRRYVTTYRHGDAYDEYDEYGEDHSGGPRVDPRAPLYHHQPDDDRGYADFETEDLLEREEDLLAAQEYAIASRGQPLTAAYAVRRGVGRHASYFREASPPRYMEQQRPARSGSIARYPRRYFDDRDAEWLTDDDDHGVVYRQYPRYTAMPYPRVYVGGGSSALRQRASSYPSPGRQSRPVPPDSPDGGMPKRRKTSAVSYDGEFVRPDHQATRAPVASAPPPVRFATNRASLVEEEGAVHTAPPLYRPMAVSAVASIEVPLSDDSSPAGSPAADSRAARVDGDVSGVEQPRERDDAGADEAADALLKRTNEEDAAMTEACDPNDDKSDHLVQAGDAVGANAVSADDANASDTTDATSHDAICDELHSEKNGTVSEPPAGDSQSVDSRLRANEAFVAALRRAGVVERERLGAQSEAAAQRAKYLALEERSKALAQLDELMAAVYDLQCCVVSTSCSLDLSVRREMLEVLDSAMQASARPEPTAQAKLALLRTGLETALARCDLETLVGTAPYEPADAVEPSDSGRTTHADAPAAHDEPAFSDDTTWTHDGSGWFEDSSEGHDNDAAMLQAVADDTRADASSSLGSLEPPESLVLKTAEDATLASSAASSYASNLFVEVASCSPSSFVMKGMQKRLLNEIERANAYYYLHPVKPFEPNRVRPQTTCEFGCGGGAAPAWIQKVIAQITSRMKWFDEITYSLARARSSSSSGGGTSASHSISVGGDTAHDANSSGGGTDRLNRKKMNSTIRKLHLMAIQLHCVVAHLYCLRGRSACKENDSLHAALNSSFFEKRMIAYKARLKLDGDLHGTPDELLRDTFEFFPEFLLCLEMWGYDYREGRSETGRSALRVGRKALPLGFFARVEASVFDYEADRNGYLQTVCEELLSIVCLWNDFVWGDNLRTLAVERIAAFEADIKKSTAKILQTYALHLMGAWAVRLMDNPDELRGLRFTQQNAYYADRVNNLRGCTSASALRARLKPFEPTGDTVDADNNNDNNDNDNHDDDDNDADNDTRAVASAYWQQKGDVGVLEAAANPASPLRVEAVEAWGKEAAAAHLLPWSRVFQLRCELETCGVVVSDLGKAATRTRADAAALLRLVEQARVVGTDAAAVCETIARHFASFQLPHEPRHAASAARSASVAFVADTDATNPTPQTVGNSVAGAADSLAQPDVKDLIQILVSTRKEIQEIFCARTRSGRVRDKLQAQSVQLAQQTIDLLQTIAARRSA
ncbi:hypothetical protein PybrP1_011657 [[Pythium] brassicae (nom. inval.)]|nr:hypothetical protein PybrP1_011657 [[Pythium] brassicae (nom. inval.)]